MPLSGSVRHTHGSVLAAAAAALACLAGMPGAASGQQIVAGQNVNMVGGPWSFDPGSGRIVGDPFLQRQNEPSIAVSSRNSCHLLAGANDYRAVDVPGLPGDEETGDAWLGLFKSIDCGQTWTSTLLPGYPQDLSAEGLSSPAKGLPAAADPTVRPGPGGLFYYSGIAFDRGSKDLGKVFVARFLDHNNKEQGDPIQYLGAAQIDLGTAGQFIDKPWIAVDIPRHGETCNVNGEIVPGGPVYLVYTNFVGGTNNPHSKILFSRSDDCGATWSNPTKLSESYALNQGTVAAVSPVDGSIYVAWRGFADPALSPDDPATVHTIMFARSTDGGKSFTKAVPVDAALHPFDQGSSAVSFRSNAYPTMAVDAGGRIYVAWAARGFASASPDPVTGDARIVLSTSADGGASWSMPRSVVDNYPGRGHQIMPALAVAAGKLVLAYYDFRADVSQVFGRYANEAEAAVAGVRHTVDLRAAMADPGNVPVFTDYATVSGSSPARPSSQASRYLVGSYYRNGVRVMGVPLQYNPPNLPMFAQGTVPFIGDYIDVAAAAFYIDAAQQWQFNSQVDPAGRRLPLFHVAWADNRDVRRPPPGQTWASYKSPTIGPSGQVCDPGTNPGSRDQNVYTAPLMPGLVVSAPGNQKTLGRIQRAYVVYARNTTQTDRSYALSIGPVPAGAWASFTPIDEGQIPAPATSGHLGPLLIPRLSSIARTVFIVSTGARYPEITVNVAETAGTGGQTPASGAVVLNPDIANPDIANPDIANPDIANPDIANAEVFNPDIANVTVDTPDIANPDIANPDIANPDIANPDIANATVANPDIANPDIANPDIANPDIANPDIANPDIANPDIANFTITDVTWTIRNKGNTTAAYAFRAKLAHAIPAGAKLQLIVRRVFVAPRANPANDCAPPEPAIQNQVLVNIPNPTLDGSLVAAFDPQRFDDNASFFLLPSDEGRVTLRMFCPRADAGCPASLDQALSLAAARVEAQAPNNCPAGAPQANCQVNGFQPDDIYDVTPPVTGCTVTIGGVAHACADGPFYTAGAADVTLSPTDAIGVATTACTIDGVPCGALTIHVSTEGPHTLTYSSTDFSGNVEPAAMVDIRVDRTPPAISGITGLPSGPDVWTSAASVTGTVAVTDTSPVVVTCADSLDGVSVSGLAVTVSGDGSHQIVCTVADEAGNASQTGATVNLDATPPLVGVPQVTIVAEAAGPAGAVATFVVSGSDALDSQVAVRCTPPSASTFPVGTTPVTCTATDHAGNAASGSFSVTVRDTSPPAVTLSGSNAMTIESGTTFVDPGAAAADLVDGAVPVTVSGSVLTHVPGSYTLTYSATDRAGNTGAATRTVTVVDTTPPTVTVAVTPTTIWSPNGKFVPVTVSGTAIDGGSGISGVSFAVKDEYGQVQPTGAVTVAAGGTYSFSVPLQASRLGSDKNGRTYTISVTAADRVGRTTTVSQVVVAVDHNQ